MALRGLLLTLCKSARAQVGADTSLGQTAKETAGRFAELLRLLASAGVRNVHLHVTGPSECHDPISRCRSARLCATLTCAKSLSLQSLRDWPQGCNMNVYPLPTGVQRSWEGRTVELAYPDLHDVTGNAHPQQHHGQDQTGPRPQPLQPRTRHCDVTQCGACSESSVTSHSSYYWEHHVGQDRPVQPCSAVQPSNAVQPALSNRAGPNKPRRSRSKQHVPADTVSHAWVHACVGPKCLLPLVYTLHDI